MSPAALETLRAMHRGKGYIVRHPSRGWVVPGNGGQLLVTAAEIDELIRAGYAARVQDDYAITPAGEDEAARP